MPVEQEWDPVSGISVLRPAGRLDSGNSQELELLVQTAFREGVRKLVFDLSRLDYISSAGLRVILFAGKTLRKDLGKVVLVGMKETVREVFAMSGFLAMFPVGGTLEDGMRFFER
jgi:anti-anti-sigma factor